MKVRDAMTKKVCFCGPETNLAEAADLMWRNSCGFLPVVGEGGNVIGVITDRDVSIALGTRNRRPSEIRVSEVMGHRLFTCTAEDNVHTALKTMCAERIRRLPVIDREEALVGILSLDDLARKAQGRALTKDVSYRDLEDAYKVICGHLPPCKTEGWAAAGLSAVVRKEAVYGRS